MTRQYPIWNDVTNCAYKSSKSYGNKEDGRVTIKVGTSSSNSHTLCDHRVTHKINDDGSRTYKYSINDIIIIEARLDKNADELTFVKNITAD